MSTGSSAMKSWWAASGIKVTSLYTQLNGRKGGIKSCFVFAKMCFGSYESTMFKECLKIQGKFLL